MLCTSKVARSLVSLELLQLSQSHLLIVIESDIHLIGSTVFVYFVCLFVQMSFRYFINYIIDYILWVICANENWNVCDVASRLRFASDSEPSGKSTRDEYREYGEF